MRALGTGDHRAGLTLEHQDRSADAVGGGHTGRRLIWTRGDAADRRCAVADGIVVHVGGGDGIIVSRAA